MTVESEFGMLKLNLFGVHTRPKSLFSLFLYIIHHHQYPPPSMSAHQHIRYPTIRIKVGFVSSFSFSFPLICIHTQHIHVHMPTHPHATCLLANHLHWVSFFFFSFFFPFYSSTSTHNCHNHDLLQPSPTHSRAHKLNPEILHWFPTLNTDSRPCLNTPDPIRLNPITCTYLSLVLVPCLSLPHIRYSTSTSFPLSVSLSSPSPSLSTLYHPTLNCHPSYPHYILCSSPYIWSPIPILSRYISLSARSISSRTLVSSSSVW